MTKMRKIEQEMWCGVEGGGGGIVPIQNAKFKLSAVSDDG
jgi:hypothetical protein